MAQGEGAAVEVGLGQVDVADLGRLVQELLLCVGLLVSFEGVRERERDCVCVG